MISIRIVEVFYSWIKSYNNRSDWITWHGKIQKVSRTGQPIWKTYTWYKFVWVNLQIQTLSLVIISISAGIQIQIPDPGLWGCMINFTPYCPTSLKKDFKFFSLTWVKIGWNARYPERTAGWHFYKTVPSVSTYLKFGTLPRHRHRWRYINVTLGI